MATIGRSIVHIILTFIVYIVTVQFYYWPDSSDLTNIKTVSYAISGALLILACWQYSKIVPYKIRAKMVQNPARFSPDKIDCYVSVQGLATGESVLPFSGEECAFYITDVFAEWRTKMKKPYKLRITERKKLLSKQSADGMEIHREEQRIYVKVEDFTKSWVQLRRNEKSEKKCPAEAKSMVQDKYKTYQIIERFAYNGDTITAQGKLTRHPDGRLFIKPTGLLKFPSFVIISKKMTDVAQFTKQIAQEALRHVSIKQVDIASLVINALLLFYVSIAQNR